MRKIASLVAQVEYNYYSRYLYRGKRYTNINIIQLLKTINALLFQFNKIIINIIKR